MPVRARCRVTRGAVTEVPISGARVPCLTGQVTSRASMSKGAAKSEPSGHPALLRPLHRRRVRTTVRQRRAGCTRGERGVRVSAGGAHHTRGNECIYGVILRLGWARAGPRTVQEQCQNSARTVQEQCHNCTLHRPPDHPTTRHPTPDIRYTPPVMYPGYIVTRCRGYGNLLLPYPISAKVTIWTCGHHASANRGYT